MGSFEDLNEAAGAIAADANWYFGGICGPVDCRLGMTVRARWIDVAHKSERHYGSGALPVGQSGTFVNHVFRSRGAVPEAFRRVPVGEYLEVVIEGVSDAGDGSMAYRVHRGRYAWSLERVEAASPSLASAVNDR